MAQTQKERVELAVETAAETIKADNGSVQMTTATEAMALLEGYEPSANEAKLFTRAWTTKQLEVGDAPEGDIEGDDGGAVEVVAADNGKIDPFADDDEELEVKSRDDERAEAVARAREILGDAADTADPAEAILALRAEGHPFYRIMKQYQTQATKFQRDFRKTQPTPEGGGSSRSQRLSKKLGFQETLATMRYLLSQARKGTDKEKVREDLETVKELADEIMVKVEDK